MSLHRTSTARRVLTGALVGGALIVTAGSANATSTQTFNIDVNVTSSEYAVTNIVEFTSGPDGTASGQFSIPQGGGDIFNGFSFTGAPSAYNVMLVGIAGSGGTRDESPYRRLGPIHQLQPQWRRPFVYRCVPVL